MQTPQLSVRELSIDDIAPLTQYWLSCTNEYLHGMGVDVNKMPAKEWWIQLLQQQLLTPHAQKQSFCVIWHLNDEPVGHSNINKIIPLQEAYMHLHIWKQSARKSGYGLQFIYKTLPFYFNTYQLQHLYCEPYALNPAPNKTLAKAGFTFLKEYITTPGFLNFEQPVNRWHLSRNAFMQLQHS